MLITAKEVEEKWGTEHPITLLAKVAETCNVPIIEDEYVPEGKFFAVLMRR